MRLRAPEPADAAAVLELVVARDIADLGRPDYTLEDVRADWAAPGVDLALDAWIAEEDGAALGYALLDDRGAALITVPPASEGRGVGTALREAAEARALERGEALVRQYVPTSNEAARTVLLGAGYWPAYSYFRMRMELAAAPEPPAGVRVRPFSRGPDDAPVHALVEEAMAGVAGNEPRSLESWQAARVDKEGWDPALWLLHEDADGLAGVVLCERWEEDRVGYVDYLAVAARARGQGLGRALLLHGLTALRDAGLTTAELSVQGENAGATRLYESIGMRPVWTIERWEKPLRALSEPGSPATGEAPSSGEADNALP
jgi:mycothiol synthase